VEESVATGTPLVSCERCSYTEPPIAEQSAERRAEAAGWHELHSLIDRLTPEQAMRPGYYAEGWTVRDLIGHLGSWLAEASALFEQMRAGTYVEGELDIDEANARFFALMRGVPLETVTLQAWAARWRMLSAWALLPAPAPPAADWWLHKAGADHYAEHLPRLREWVAELTAD
jgi:hypothetical protein